MRRKGRQDGHEEEISVWIPFKIFVEIWTCKCMNSKIHNQEQHNDYHSEQHSN